MRMIDMSVIQWRPGDAVRAVAGGLCLLGARLGPARPALAARSVCNSWKFTQTCHVPASRQLVGNLPIFGRDSHSFSPLPSADRALLLACPFPSGCGVASHPTPPPSPAATLVRKQEVSAPSGRGQWGDTAAAGGAEATFSLMSAWLGRLTAAAPTGPSARRPRHSPSFRSWAPRWERGRHLAFPSGRSGAVGSPTAACGCVVTILEMSPNFCLLC